MANLLDRLAEPRRCLQRVPHLVKSGGQLIITSPYTWPCEFTPRENRLGGYEQDGRLVRTFDTLKEILSPDFDFTFKNDLPLLIREHARKFQWSVAEASVRLLKHGTGVGLRTGAFRYVLRDSFWLPVSECVHQAVEVFP